LALPVLASADSIDIANSGGTMTGSASGLSLSGSTMIKYGSIVASDLGSVSFTTGVFVTGSAAAGGTLAPGGTFTITGNGTNGVPSGTIFTGTFTSAQWLLQSSSAGNTYVLIGAIDGVGASATTSQITITIATGKGFFNGEIGLGSGDTILTSTVPEPGTLGLLGTGLLAGGGLVRRMRNRA
jgi:hypothetical protein